MSKIIGKVWTIVLLAVLLLFSQGYCQRAPEQDFLDRGRKYLYDKQYDQALEEFSKAIETNPNSFLAYDGRAETYFMTGDYAGSIADYSKTVELEPDSWFVYQTRGFVYFTQKDLPAAIADCDKALELSPDEAYGVYNLRAEVYAAQGDYLRAIEDLNKLMVIDKFSVDYALLAKIYFQMKDYDKAWAQVSRVESMIPAGSDHTAAYYFDEEFLSELKAASGREK